jgi:mitochondrial ATPase complex subunit ATP10
MSRPYFRDWGNMKFHHGKTFICPPRLFRADTALYFPNLFGRTLVKGDKLPRNTTPVLRGRVSVVTVYSNLWAENQCRTFVSPESNPGVEHIISTSGGDVQHVRVNVEEDALKAFLGGLWRYRLRRQVGPGNHGRWFQVRGGLTDHIRESIGLLNSKVGYTYLLDANCKIRWAGCGNSTDDERLTLTRSLQGLLVEHRTEAKVDSRLDSDDHSVD